MSAYSDVVFNLRTTNVRGIGIPMKSCGDFKWNFWSFNVDDMDERLRYLREDFVVKDTDVYICTYPRSGTNWTHEIVQMLLRGKAEFAPLFAFFENLAPNPLEKLEHPRVICTHLPLEFLPTKITEIAKIICVFRNPKDIAVSLHNYFLKINFLNHNATFSEFLELFINGEVPCGQWFDHVQNWEKIIEEYKSAKVLTLKYEDMKLNLLENVQKIAEFLGVQHKSDLLADISDKCEFQCQFQERTTNVHEIIAKLTKDAPNFLYRKGAIGDWKNWFTVAESERFDQIYQERMKNSKLHIQFSE